MVTSLKISNYRGIRLMSMATKVYNKILLNWIREPIDKILRPNQAGFQQGKSCTHQVHIIRRSTESANDKNLHHFCRFQEGIWLNQQRENVRNPASQRNPRKAGQSKKKKDHLQQLNNLALLESDLERPQYQLNKTAKLARQVGLDVNVKKTEGFTY